MEYYWINQNIIDGVVNGVAKVAKVTANFTYRFIDQGAVDGTVNGLGRAADESGEVLRAVQSGRLQQYAALLFGAAAIIGLTIALLN